MHDVRSYAQLTRCCCRWLLYAISPASTQLLKDVSVLLLPPAFPWQGRPNDKQRRRASQPHYRPAL